MSDITENKTLTIEYINIDTILPYARNPRKNDKAVEKVASSLKEAKLMGIKYYYTGKSCPRGHISLRDARNSGCCECIKENNLKWKRDIGNQTDALKKSFKKYREKHTEQSSVYGKQRYKDNKEFILEKTKEYRQNNNGKVAAHIRKRQLSKRNATPQWYEKDLVEMLYKKRDELNKLWGTKFEVEHIIPLKGKNVCGLHCWMNLQLMDATLNRQKFISVVE